VELELIVKHIDGSATHMSIIARSGGGQYLRLTGPGTMAYQSLFGFFKSWAAIRPFSDQELAALRSQVGTNQSDRPAAAAGHYAQRTIMHSGGCP
jgi:hypothetical protein